MESEKILCINEEAELNKETIDDIKSRLLESEPKPCPFCGGKAEIVDNAFSKFFTKNNTQLKNGVVVMCSKCSVSTGTYDFGELSEKKKFAIKIWNTRTNKAEQIFAELKEWLKQQGMNQDVRALIRVSYALDKIKELQNKND